jgi:uncharacterized repeat protein (TIGR01451 family)
MLSMPRSLTALFLAFCSLALAIVAQPNTGALASTTPSGRTGSPATQTDVGIHVEVTGSTFQPGDVITLTLIISNNGPDIASGITVTDIVPAQILTSTFSSTLNLTATGTVTYAWSIDPLGPGESGVITISGQLDPALPDNFSFTNTATITDPDDIFPDNNVSQIFVGTYQVFLPGVMRNWPPVPGTPVLNPISNPSNGNFYPVSWSASTAADTYTVQRDTVQDFSHPTVAYDGSSLYFVEASGAGPGNYYYRVRANNSLYGTHSPWSNVVSTTVQPPTCDVWVYNETGANITMEIVGVAKQDFAPGTYKWVTIPFGMYVINTWTSLYYYHITKLIDTPRLDIHVGS